MPAALLITLLVGTGLSGTPFVTAMRGALVEVLGDETRIDQRFVDEPAQRADDMVREGGHGVVAWVKADEDGLFAVLQVRREGAVEWQSRSLRFAKADAVEERGRATGFVLAAMVRPGVVLPPAAARVSADSPADSPSHSTWAADLMALAASGLGGSAGGLGGGVGLRRTWGSGLGLRLGGAVLTRELDSGDLRLWSARVALGASVGRTLSPSFVLGARLDALAVWEIAAQTEGGARDRQGRVLPGAAALVEAAWKVSPRFHVLADAGLEGLFGHTSVFLDERAIATVPPWRVVAEVGVRIDF